MILVNKKPKIRKKIQYEFDRKFNIERLDYAMNSVLIEGQGHIECKQI